nr:hypothetical protein BaRGS_013152 [Batillaria attramentaria]
MLSDLQLAEKETEKQQPLEKQRHYDAESVRQFMARQKAERQRKREEAKKAQEQEAQKRQQLMQELISKQRSAASVSKLGSDSDKENSEMNRPIDDEDDSDGDTLTGDSEEGSTPRATPVNAR